MYYAILNIAAHAFLMGIFCVLALHFFFFKPHIRENRTLRIVSGVLMLTMMLQEAEWLFCSIFLSGTPIAADLGRTLMVDALAFPLVMGIMMTLLPLIPARPWNLTLGLVYPAFLTIAYYVLLVYGIAWREYLAWLQLAWIVGSLALFMPGFIRGIRRHETLLNDIYADTDGHSLRWVARMLMLLVLLMVTYAVLKLWLRSELADIVNIILSALFWIGFVVNVDHMIPNSAEDIMEENALPDEQTPSVIRVGNVPAEIMQSTESAQGEDTTEKEFITRLRQTIIDNHFYAEPGITRYDIARAMGINYVYLTQQLKSEAGTTLACFVADIRLDLASRMLREHHQMPLDQVARECGFTNQATFSRLFLERYHLTPTEYRQKA